MPEYRKLFAEMFDGIKPASSDEDFVGGILERADNMSTERKITDTGSGFYELPEYKERKSSRLPGIFAGVAGTAAVLACAVFGLKFLSEYGGLREGGPEGPRAGHSDAAAVTTTEPEYSDSEPAVQTTTATVVTAAVPEQITDSYDVGELYCEVGDYSVHITGYEFNTVLLRVYYEVSRVDGEPLSDGEGNELPLFVGSGHPYTVTGLFETDRSETSVKYVADIIPDEPSHTLDVYMESGKDEFKILTARCDTSNYVFRIPCDVEGVDPSISELFISQSEAILKYKVSEETEMIDASVDIRMKDGIPMSFADSHYTVYDPEKRTGYVFMGFAEPCDARRISEVYVGGVRVYASKDTELIVTSAVADDLQGVWYEETEQSELSDNVSVMGWRYDGRILAVHLKGDDGNELRSLSMRSVSDPRTLIQSRDKENGGTYTLWALLDVPEGSTDTIQIVDLSEVAQGQPSEPIMTIQVQGEKRGDVRSAGFETDMTEYGMPGVTLERMTLSRYGLELLFVSNDENAVRNTEAEVLMGDIMVPIKGIHQMTVRDEESGLYYSSVVVYAENMMGVDMSCASRITVNGFTTDCSRFTEGTDSSIYDKLPRRNVGLSDMQPVGTSVSIRSPEENR